MKENFFNNTFNKAKKGIVVAAAVTATILPVENINAQNNKDAVSKDKIEYFESKKEEITAETFNFKDFNPSPDKKFIKIEDPELKAYVMENYSITDFKNQGLGIKENEAKKIKIKDPKEFKKEILDVAATLGFSEEKIENLSVNDAIMLCGNILAKKLSYNYEMIDPVSDSTENIETKIAKSILNSFNGVDTRNEEAKRVDSEYQDRIFSEGLGICRNYASVNVAIFEVLKKIDDDSLKNTYMKWYSPESLEESLMLPHSWNQVINISNKDNKLKLSITYVDPTWLDTRKKTSDASGVETQSSDKDMYNAFDENHFFSGCLSAHVEIAKLYELLGNYSNRVSNEIGLKKLDFCKDEKLKLYQELAFLKRLEVCRIALDSAKINKEDVSKSKQLFKKFQVSLLEAVSNMQGNPIGMSSIVGPTFYESTDDKIDLKKLEEIKNILLQAKQVFSFGVDKHIKMRSYSNDGAETNYQIPFFSIIERLEKSNSQKLK